MKFSNIKYYLILNLMLLLYSIGGIFAKMASKEVFMSPEFCLLYGAVLVNLAIYAIFWQQILRKLPLTSAYANRAVTIIWGTIWGTCLFGETLTYQKMAGIALVIAGILLMITPHTQREDSA